MTAAKTSYYHTKIARHKGDLKKTWSAIHELRGKRNSAINSNFVINNQLITERRVIANEFNKYFVSLATKLNDPDDYTIINSEPLNLLLYFSNNPIHPVYTYTLQDSTPDEIRSTIGKWT